MLHTVSFLSVMKVKVQNTEEQDSIDKDDSSHSL